MNELESVKIHLRLLKSVKKWMSVTNYSTIEELVNYMEILKHLIEKMSVMNFSTIEELEEWFIKMEDYFLPENIKKRQDKYRKSSK
ncbi:hypothetical protein N9L07_01395 [Flavobacteriaceae bacterium]|nr:hypothetical protein [Flavobacteriaceae bacterium]